MLAFVTAAGRNLRFDLHPVPGYGVTVEDMNSQLNWAPEACTLPTVDQPLRIAEFGRLFDTALRGVARVDSRRLRLSFDAAARPEVVRLTEAETACCGFFTFTVGEPEAGSVTVEVEVPAQRVDVLDGLAAQAAGAKP